MTAVPAPWNGIAIPKPSRGRVRLCRLLPPDELAADLAAFVVRRVKVDVRSPGLEIGDLSVGQRCRTLDRVRKWGIAQRHEDTGICCRSGWTVDMASCWGQPGIS